MRDNKRRRSEFCLVCKEPIDKGRIFCSLNCSRLGTSFTQKKEDPTIDEIEKIAQEIQSTWSKKDQYSRLVTKPSNIIPEIRSSAVYSFYPNFEED